MSQTLTRRHFLKSASLAGASVIGTSRFLAQSITPGTPQGFHFGAVYYRGQNQPPREDWKRDHRVASEDGHTLLRHWVPWNVVEISPGKYLWDDYAIMLDLAAAHGIRVVLAEMLVDFPEWLIAAHPEARIQMPSGQKRASEMHISSRNGGHHTLCLNHSAVSEAAQLFLTALAARFRGHPALLGYDIWNECTQYTAERLCFCSACQQAFRKWLQTNHPDITTLAKRWHRPSLTAFDQVELPRTPLLFPDFLDSIRWRNHDAQHWMRWRRDTLKQTDPTAVIIAHGNAKTHADASVCVGDDFLAAQNCEVFGYTHYFGNGHSSLLSGDLIRGAAQGKPFWRAEAIGGPQWFRRKIGEPRPAMDELDDPSAIRLDALQSMAAGATAYLNPRWRSLLDGPLFGAFGWYADDGSRTAKSEQIKSLAAWVARPDVAKLWSMKPARSDVAIVLVDESQDWTYAMQGDTNAYAGCVRGLHRGLTAAGLSCDFIKPEPTMLQPHQLAYVPFPVALSARTLSTLMQWAEAGGHLVLEACAGYFDELAHSFPKQPNRQLGSLFGPIVARTSFALDQHADLKIHTPKGQLTCALYRQSFLSTADHEVLGHYEDGSAAMIRRGFGKGFITLIGSNPSFAMNQTTPSVPVLQLLLKKNDLAQSGVSPCLVRHFVGQAERAVWVVNPTQKDCQISLPSPTSPEMLRGRLMAFDHGSSAVQVSIPAQDAAVLLFKLTDH